MPFYLTKQDKARRAELIEKLNAAKTELDAKVEDVNDAVQTAIDALRDGIEAYNELVQEAVGFRDDIVSQAEEDFSDKSERWQEGERGEAARAWIDEWEGLDLIELDVPQIELVQLETDVDLAEALAEAPDRAD